MVAVTPIANLPCMSSAPNGGDATVDFHAASSSAPVKDVPQHVIGEALTLQCPGLVAVETVRIEGASDDLRAHEPTVVGVGDMLRVVVNVRGTLPEDVKILGGSMRC